MQATSLQNRQLLQEAVACHQSGDLAKAQVLYKNLLQAQPLNSDALHLLGVIHIQSKQYDQAIGLIDQAIQVRPDMTAAHFNRALALKALNRMDAAQAGFAKTLALDPNYTQALLPRGVALQSLGRLEEALACFKAWARYRAEDASAHANLGVVLFQLKRWPAAQQAFEQALKLQPGDATHHFNLATVFQEQARLDEALQHYDRAIELKADYFDALHNRGNVLKDLRRYEEALGSLNQAIALHPQDAQAYSNRGNLYKAMLKLEEAERDYETAIRLNPSDADAHFNQSITYLLQGQFDRGWAAYEWRWKTNASQHLVRNYDVPAWRGEFDVRGKTILLYTEQGLGDTLQFCRYAAVLANRGARVVMEVPASLLGVLQHLEGVSQWVVKGQALPPFDAHCPLLSLPLALGTNLDSIPSPTPYLFASPDKIQKWSQQLGSAHRPRVGIVWRGSATHNNDRNRSIGLADFIRHLPAHLDYVSLQKEVSPEDNVLLQATPGLRHFGGALEDFTDTAALCSLMDVVVSVDTSVAHLSGALGKDVRVLLPYSPDWRWLIHRSDSPWYASMRLYRQGPDLRWPPVLQRLAQDLPR